MLSLFVCLFCLFTSVKGLILVVGDVSDTSARVLVDQGLFETTGDDLIMTWFQLGKRKAIHSTGTIQLSEKAQVIQVDGLLPSTSYQVHFIAVSENGVGPEIVKFKTRASIGRTEGEDSTLKIINLSCDRHYEDGDTDFWKELTHNEESFDGTVNFLFYYSCFTLVLLDCLSSEILLDHDQQYSSLLVPLIIHIQH